MRAHHNTVSLTGEDAIALAEALGLPLRTVSPVRAGFRELSPADARSYLARRPEYVSVSSWADGVWLPVATEIA